MIQALVSPHFLAFLIDSCFCMVKLTDGENNEALAYAKENFRAYFFYFSYEILKKNRFFPGISILTSCGESN